MNMPLPPILCVGFPAWEGDYQKSTVQLMRALAIDHDVLYVEYPFSWKDVFQGLRHGNKPYRRIMGLQPRLRSMEGSGQGSLHVLTLPPMFPVNGLEPGKKYDRMAAYNAEKAARSIRKAIRILGFSTPLMINAYNPFLGVFLHGNIHVLREYYYCYDQIGAARWTNRHGPRLEEQYLHMVDGLFTSSQPLLDEKLPEGKAGIVVKNGVNLSLFEQAFEAEPTRNDGPVLGYLGSIDDRMDLDLVLGALDRWPEARLLMVGRIMEPEIEERLARHPRVELAGAQQPEKLPGWVRKMDIGLIPFVKNEFTRFIYPLKINEYLAAGLPVVSTSFSDLSDFESIIGIGDDTDTFLSALRLAWESDSPEVRTERQAFARHHSWEARAQQLSTWLHDELLVHSGA